MPPTPRPLRKLGFLTIGLFDAADPRRGHESTLEIIELGERLGFDSAWVRHRHLQYGVSSPVAVLAAASQRTRRIELGTAVIPLGWENPLRLAEDLATVDLLSGGRLNPGVSVGPPMHFDQVKDALYPDTADAEDFGYGRVERLLDFVRGKPATDFSGAEGFEVFSDRVQPHSPAWAAASGTAAAACGRPGGPASTALTSSPAVSSRPKSPMAPTTSRRSSSPRSAPSAPPTPTARPPASRRAWSSSPRTRPRPDSAPGTRSTPRGAPPARRHRRDRRGCCSRRTWSGPRRRSPDGCGRTPRSGRWTRWRSPCRSPSSTRTTCRSSPTWPQSWARPWDGSRAPRPVGVVLGKESRGLPGEGEHAVAPECAPAAPARPPSDHPGRCREHPQEAHVETFMRTFAHPGRTLGPRLRRPNKNRRTTR